MFKRVLSGISISVLITVVTLFGQIFTVPILLGAWGQEVYGEWIVLTSLSSSITLLNFGVQTYVGNILILHYTHHQIETGTRVLRAALRLYILLSGIAIILIIAVILSPTFLADLNIQHIQGARYIILLQGGFSIYSIIGGLLMSLFRVIQQMPRQLVYGLIERIIILLTPMMIALLGGSPILAISGMVVLIAVISAVAIRDIWQRTPFKIGVTGVTWRESVALIRPSFTFYFVSLTTTILSSGTILVISSFIGSSSVVVFSTTLMLSNLVRIVISQILNVLWPEITAIPPQDRITLQHWHRLTLKIITGIALFGGAGIILLGIPTLRIWTQNNIAVDSVLNLLLTVYLMLHAPEMCSRIFGLATNRQNSLLLVEVSRLLVTMIALILFVPVWQVRGAALALIIGQSISTLLVFRLASSWTQDGQGALLQDWLWRGKYMLIIWFAVPLAFTLLTDNIEFRVLILLLLTLPGFFIAWISWLNLREQQLVRSVVFNLIGR
jgi:O-antigen/teichoic acid export membrane protein